MADYRTQIAKSKIVKKLPTATKQPKPVSVGIGGIAGAQPAKGPTAFTPSPVTVTPNLQAQQAAAQAAAHAAAVKSRATSVDYSADPTYQAAVAALRQQYNDNELALVGEEAAQKKAYGYDDDSDPFSRAAQLRERLQVNKKTAGNSMAAGGQLWSGAYQNAQNYAQEDYTQADDATRKEYQAVLAEIARRRREAANALGSNLASAQQTALATLLASRPDDSDVSAAEAAAQAAAAAAAGTPAPAAPASPQTQATAAATAQATAQAQAQAAQQAAQNAASAKPKPGYAFVQDSGPRKGQSYNVVKINGKNYRRYADGTTIPQ